jgi:hypothetical protein
MGYHFAGRDTIKDTIKPQIRVPTINCEIEEGEDFNPMKNVSTYDETDCGV